MAVLIAHVDAWLGHVISIALFRKLPVPVPGENVLLFIATCVANMPEGLEQVGQVVNVTRVVLLALMGILMALLILVNHILKRFPYQEHPMHNI